MKHLRKIWPLLLITNMLFAQVQIDEMVYINTGGTLFINSDLAIVNTGSLVNNGNLILEGNITGDSLLDLTSTANLQLSGGTLSLGHQNDESINNLVLDQSGVLVVLPGNTLTINGDYSNTSTGTALKLLADITGYSQLLVNGIQSGSGEVTKEIYLSGNSGWRNLASPVTTTIEDLRNTGEYINVIDVQNGSVFTWDAATANWQVPVSLSANFEREKGYFVYAGAFNGNNYLTALPNNIDLTGSLNDNSDLTVALSYNDGQSTLVDFVGGTTLGATEGWNMIPNPYPCTYDWDGQSLPSGTDNAIYVWNANGGLSGSYTQYVNGVGVNGGQRYIAPAQSFFVQTHTATPGSLNLLESQRTIDEKPVFYKTQGLTGHMRMQVFSILDSSNSDENYLEFRSDATDDFDGTWDARERLNGSGTPNLFYALGKDYLSINRMDTFSIYKTVPMRFRCDIAGNYIIQPNLEDMPIEWFIELEDLQTESFHDLREGGLQIEHLDGQENQLFILHINRKDNPKYIDKHIDISGYGDLVEVKFSGPITGDKMVRIYDLSGKLLLEKQLSENQTEVTIPMKSNTAKILVVHAESNITSASKKVVLSY